MDTLKSFVADRDEKRICSRCRRREAAPDKRCCEKCLTQMKVYTERPEVKERVVARGLAQRRALRAAGLCVDCKAPTKGKRRCERCAERHNAARRRRCRTDAHRAKARAYGLIWRQGPVYKAWVKANREKNAQRQRDYRARIKRIDPAAEAAKVAKRLATGPDRHLNALIYGARISKPDEESNR